MFSIFEENTTKENHHNNHRPAIKQLIAQGVADALAEIEANRTSRNGDDNHDSGTGSRRTKRAARECTYSDFLKCQPLNVKGTEGVVSLTQWFEKMESIFHISNCTVRARSSLIPALSWPRSRRLKLILEPKVKGTDVVSYKQRFQKLALMCGIMFLEESDEVEKYVGWTSRHNPGKQAENKRKLDNDNQAQQQPPKKQNMAIAYIVGSGKRKEYVGTLSLCNKSPITTNNQRTLACYECGNQGHYKIYCQELKNPNHGNKAGGAEARGMVYALGGRETDQDIDDMEDDINT
ncbi:hypothetical protein Tco_0776141 [Tanacetum coccineum]